MYNTLPDFYDLLHKYAPILGLGTIETVGQSEFITEDLKDAVRDNLRYTTCSGIEYGWSRCNEGGYRVYVGFEREGSLTQAADAAGWVKSI